MSSNKSTQPEGEFLPANLPKKVGELMQAGLTIDKNDAIALIRDQARKRINRDLKDYQKQLNRYNELVKELRDGIQNEVELQAKVKMQEQVETLNSTFASIGWSALELKYSTDFEIDRKSPSKSKYQIHVFLKECTPGQGRQELHKPKPTAVTFGAKLQSEVGKLLEAEEQVSTLQDNICALKLKSSKIHELEDAFRGKLMEFAMGQSAEGGQLRQYIDDSGMLDEFLGQ